MKFDQDGRRINVVPLEEGIREELAREQAAKAKKAAVASA